MKRKKQKSEQLHGWRIITRENRALGLIRYRVFLPGFVTRFGSRPNEYRDFDTYDEALRFYYEKTGWKATFEVQPGVPPGDQKI